MSQADDQRRADAFADLSIRFVEGLPRTLVAQRMAGQYLDASTSAAANYRAARKGRSHDEFIAKLSVASEEADESVFWLNRFKNAGISSNAADIRPLLEEAEELAKIFGASVRTARGRRRRRRDGDPPRR